MAPGGEDRSDAVLGACEFGARLGVHEGATSLAAESGLDLDRTVAGLLTTSACAGASGEFAPLSQDAVDRAGVSVASNPGGELRA